MNQKTLCYLVTISFDLISEHPVYVINSVIVPGKQKISIPEII